MTFPPVPRITDYLDLLGSAVAVSKSVEMRKQPDPRHLRRIGIDPEAFAKIRYL